MTRDCVLLFSVLVALDISWPCAHCQERPTASVKGIVQQAIEAHGGRDRVVKLRTQFGRAKGTHSPVDGKEIPISFAFWYQHSEKCKYIYRLGRPDERQTCFILYNGKRAWGDLGCGLKVAESDDSDARLLRERCYLQYVLTLTPLLDDSSLVLHPLAERVIDGAPALGVEVLCEGHRRLGLYFDKKTRHLVCVESLFRVNKEKYLPLKEIRSDFKDFDGLKIPMRTRQYLGGKKILDLEFLEVRFPAQFAATEFTLKSIPQKEIAQGAIELIRKAVEAHGGRKNLLKARAMLVRGEGTDFVSGNSISAEEIFVYPDKMRTTLRCKVAGESHRAVTVYNAGRAWVSEDGKTRELSGEVLQNCQHSIHQLTMLQLLPLLEDSAFVLTPVKETLIGRRPALGIKVSSANHPAAYLYFDKKSGLLLKLERREFTEGQERYICETFFEDYKDIEGVQVAMKKRIVLNGRTLIAPKLTEVLFSPKLDKHVFDKP
jgi:hypothetical protein